ncbi:hypothetical protein O181_016417 [Austropuccinia psidii MF-1]|uniref:Reverse transcriptase Ty1/copia-type domain-containing protein n=1 Tax=Austropuccinia psidii MF-1 TaxID=1389203 RepID=A0A9Q3C5L3_9BASI|nr:hypothetical protein [Austropuccinia psidii MF-1]
MEDLGPAKFSLGIRIDQNNKKTSPIQETFIKNIFNEFNVLNLQPASYPLPNSYKDQVKQEPEKDLKPPFSFRRVIGLLQYVVQCTQTDLAFSCSYLLQFLNHPNSHHFKALTHVFRYLALTKHYTLTLGRNQLNRPESTVIRFKDANWNGGINKVSFSDSFIYYSGMIGWRAHKQRTKAC